ncbi:MAG: Tol-Pal system beta propeller repeat protein TolB [Gammaproteobacteria bacterium]|nr:MAG: Tol-Pal system beta propeller repeat protein TolB [Gammaproteobacteria bacterium]|tara:strand:- start:35 stop:1336 length:1302 start_codon:yes stop_codon:yes gene_type:complete
MFKQKIIYFLLFFFMQTTSMAELTIRITQGVGKQTPVAIVPFGVGSGLSKISENITEIITNDLLRSGRFSVTPVENMLQQPSTGAEIDFDDWSILGVEAVVIGKITEGRNNSYNIQFQLFDIYKREQIVGYRMPANEKTLRRSAHRIADMVFEELTGIRGVFDTKVAYVRSNASNEKRNYTLVISDSDGENEQIVLESKDPIMSPAWSPDSRMLSYVSFEGNMSTIYVQNLRTGNRRKISELPGINGSPAFSPDGRKLVLTLGGSDGNLDIHVLDIATRNLKRLTYNRSIDTEATWAPNGEEIYFTSDRGGSPQIYKMKLNSDRASRVTFEGSYNARPRLSPDGNKLAMVHQYRGDYRIAIYDIEEKDLLILSSGSQDESPSFAPNSDTLIYATKLSGDGVLETVTADGLVRQRMAPKSGDIREPVWSPFLKL